MSESSLPRALALCVLGSAACLAPPPAPNPIAIDWEPFHWASAVTLRDSFPFAFIAVEGAKGRNGQAVWHQLGLAASGTMPDGFPVAAPRRVERAHGLLAGSARLTVPLASGEALSLDRREIGTIGLPGYEHRPLIIDLARRRLGTPSDPTFDPAGLPRVLATLDLELVAGLPGVVLPLEAGREGRVRALLDTGLSPFAVWATKATWTALTGRRPDQGGTRRYVIDGPRGRLVFEGAPVTTGLRFGGRRLPAAEAVFVSEGPPGAALEQWPVPVDAVISPRVLAPEGWVVLDLRRHRILLAVP